MNIKGESTDVSNLIRLTEEFVKFVSVLYKEGTINHEQYENMTKSKVEFLKNIKTL